MNKYIIIFTILILLFTSVAVKADTLQYDLIEVYTPENIFIYNETALIITLIDDSTGEPLENYKDNISCYIKKPDGGMLLNGIKPTEISNGMYKLEFTLPGIIGTYIVWSIFDFEGKEYYASKIFEGRYNPYTNLTEAKYKIGDAVKIINLDNRNRTSQAISHSSDTTQDLEQLGVDTDELGFWERLEDTAISQFFSWTFMFLIMMGAALFSSFILRRRSNAKIAKKVSNLPASIMEELAKWLKLKKFK